ncbi:hypothetical protein TRFO_25549 [Tritrichomonas foetus]|uniref:Right handed beta helix domain-containing protein n=1 Tax=Tritrichomonas foetus TaxID=1144522 RepID=A0A1J4K5G8_9EUKA|nr:hypothetical protein TRFO_25549 [Tritrichomonas foetus]|eukprot:OHT06435.1 hypothetical protein TRFO_25549 [Tritrichomonas foetus]
MLKLVMFSLFVCFSTSINIKHIIAYAKCTNISLKASHSLSYKLDNHPLFLGINQLEKIHLTMKSITFTGLYAPLFYGNSVNLNLYDVSAYDIFNQTLVITGQSVLDRNRICLSNITFINCRFTSSFYDFNGGAFEFTDCQILCNKTLFFDCVASKGSALYASNCNAFFSDTNFSLNYARDFAATTFEMSNVTLLNCIFYANFAYTVSSIYGFFSHVYIFNCGFVSNTVDISTCVCLVNCSGLLRGSDFINNYCGVNSPIPEESGVVCLQSPNFYRIIACKFSENTLEGRKKPDTSIVLSGVGTSRILFCQFDRNEDETIQKIQPKEGKLSAIVSNCAVNLNIKSKYQTLAQEMIHSDTSFSLDIGQFTSFSFLQIAFTGVFLLFICSIVVLFCMN